MIVEGIIIFREEKMRLLRSISLISALFAATIFIQKISSVNTVYGPALLRPKQSLKTEISTMLRSIAVSEEVIGAIHRNIDQVQWITGLTVYKESLKMIDRVEIQPNTEEFKMNAPGRPMINILKSFGHTATQFGERMSRGYFDLTKFYFLPKT